MKYEIGCWVVVSAVYKKYKSQQVIDNGELCNDGPAAVEWKKVALSSPYMAIVAGACVRKDGIIHKASYSRLGWLEIKKKHVFYTVRRGMFNKDVLVKEEDMAIVEASAIPILPLLFSNQPLWDEQSRHWARQDAFRQRRENGKFVKGYVR